MKRRASLRIHYQTLVRLAQLTLMVSLCLPLLLALLPQNALPQLKFETFAPRAERNFLKLPGGEKDKIRSAMMKGPEDAEVHRWKDVWKAGFSKRRLIPLWFAGFLFACTLFLRNIIVLRRVLREGFVIRRIGRVEVIVSDAVGAPFSTLRGRVASAVFPMSILKNPRDFRIAIQHEFEHHRRHDTAWALMIEVGVCLFYANPAIYLWRREIRELQEFSCDEALIGQRGISAHEYGSALIRVAEAALGYRQVLVGTASMAAGPSNSRDFKSFLRRRIEMFSHHEAARPFRKFAGMAFGTICLAVTATIAYGAQQAMKHPEIAAVNPGQAVFNPAVQAIAEQVLSRAINSYQAKAGFVLVSDPLTGKLLAAANVSLVPTPSKSWSLSYRLEPASVMKGIVAASAVDRRQAQFSEMFDCENGSYQYAHNLFHDWKAFDHLTTAETVINSSNICGIKIGQRLGAEGLYKTLTEFGFGPGGTTQGFPEAMSGLVPTTSQLSEEEYVGLVSAGYSLQSDFKVTPLEVVQAYGAIANDGKLMKPLSAIEPDDSASMIRHALSPETAHETRLVLQRVVHEGTGKPAESRIYTTAGKTGTAFTPGTPQHDSLGGERSIGSFAGFAPVEHPRVVVYVAVIGPMKTGDHEPRGSSQAAPIFREVTERTLQYLNVPPDKGL